MLEKAEIVVSKHKAESYIEKAMSEMQNINSLLADSGKSRDSSARFASLAKTKLQEAWLWCDQIENGKSEMPM